jgi:hypothetical protein
MLMQVLLLLHFHVHKFLLLLTCGIYGQEKDFEGKEESERFYYCLPVGYYCGQEKDFGGKEESHSYLLPHAP